MSNVKRVSVGEIEMEYEEIGNGDHPLVLVHGFTGSRDDWLEQMPALGALGRTLAIDQRGHGGSTNTGNTETYTLETLVADLAGFLDAIGVERCDLLGHSLGGMVALRFVLGHRPCNGLLKVLSNLTLGIGSEYGRDTAELSSVVQGVHDLPKRLLIASGILPGVARLLKAGGMPR